MTTKLHSEWLDRLEKLSRPKSTIETITPEMAENYLQYNHNNRNIRKKHIDYLVGIIHRGEWMLTHQGIAFDTTGRLVDGQHRLTAILYAGEAVQMMVARDVNPDIFKVLDTGALRSISDITGIPRKIAEVCRTIAIIGMSSNMRPTSKQITEVCSIVGDQADLLINYAPSSSFGVSTVGIRSGIVAHTLMTPKDTNYAFDQYRALTLYQIEELSKISLSFLRKINKQQREGKINYGGQQRQKVECFIGMSLANSKLANRSYIQISDSSIAQCATLIKKMLHKNGLDINLWRQKKEIEKDKSA